MGGDNQEIAYTSEHTDTSCDDSGDSKLAAHARTLDPAQEHTNGGELKHLQMRSTDFGLGNLPTEVEPGAEAQVTEGIGNMGTW